MKRLFLGLSAIFAFASTPAFAADSGFYGAFDIGQGKLSASAPPGVALSLSNTTPFRLGVGYQFNQNFGLEGSYIDFGKSTVTATVLGVGINAGDATATGFGIAAIGSLPVSDTVELFGKVGYNSIKATATPSALYAALGGTTTSKTNNNASFGLRVKFNVSKQFAVRAQYEDFGSFGVSNVAGSTTIKATMISIGAIYAFQ